MELHPGRRRQGPGTSTTVQQEPDQPRVSGGSTGAGASETSVPTKHRLTPSAHSLLCPNASRHVSILICFKKYIIALLRYIILWFLVYSQLCNTTTKFRTFLSPSKKTQIHQWSLPLLPYPGQPLIYSMDFPIRDVSISEMIQYVVFHDWQLPFNMFSGFIHIVACVSTSFLFMAE